MGTWIPFCCNMEVYTIAKFLFRGCENKKQRLGELSHHKSTCHLRGWLDIFTTMERDVVQSQIGHKPLAMSTKPCVPTSVLASVLTNNNGTCIWIQKAQHWYLSDFSIHITYILLRGDNSHQYLVAMDCDVSGVCSGVFLSGLFLSSTRGHSRRCSGVACRAVRWIFCPKRFVVIKISHRECPSEGGFHPGFVHHQNHSKRSAPPF